MCQHLYLLLTLHVSTPVLGHHQAHDEYKLQLIELRLNSNMDPYYVLTCFFFFAQTFGINSQAIKFKLKLKLKN
jgi:hypothetical protein